jgi:hypothetical protein
MGLEFLKKLVELAGTKLPQIWPHIVQISISLQAIAEILYNGQPGVSLAKASLSDDGLDLLAQVKAQGVEGEKLEDVLSGFEHVA